MELHDSTKSVKLFLRRPLPEQPSKDGLSASFAAAKNITAEKLGEAARTFTVLSVIRKRSFLSLWPV